MVETIYKIAGAPHLALLADLHGRPFEPVIASLTARRPSIICVCGDIVYGSQPEEDISPLSTQTNVLPFLSACAALAPTYLSFGNHEWMLDDEDIKTIEDTGTVVLDNSRAERDGLVIGGLTSAYCLNYRRFLSSLPPPEQAGKRYPEEPTMGINRRREADSHTPDISWLEDFSVAPGNYHLLLSHHPEYWPLISSYPFDLCLAAHAHGGQWRLFGHGVWSPGQYWWPKYTKGVYEDGRLIVSAGLSNTARIPRILNPTEVVYIEPE